MQVSANVSGSSFNEVTFYAKTGNGGWRHIGTDDTRPYRVFHDVSSLAAGTRVAYRAVVRDNAGHTRISAPQRASRACPPAHHRGCRREGRRRVRHDRGPRHRRPRTRHPCGPDPAQPERRGLGDACAPTSSSPVYVYYDDLTAVPVGTQIRYRAILPEPTAPEWSVRVRTVTRSAPSRWSKA